MLKIGIFFNKRNFEYDVYSLVRAFYPGSDVQMVDSDEEWSGEFEVFLWIGYSVDEIHLEIAQGGKRCFEESICISEILKEDENLHVDEKRKQTKNQLKQLIYRGLHELTGQDLPWGTLTGIRPVKIPMQFLEAGKKNTEIAEYMRNTYYISPQKTALSIAIANRERDILKDLDPDHGYSLYVGIPFCPSVCLYCSFGSHPVEKWKDRIDEYLDALFQELTYIGEEFSDWKLSTIYIGGGTPTSLTAEQLHRLLHHLTEHFDVCGVKEFTVEAGRPDSITREKLLVLKEFPVSRISVNPQTMNQETLDVIGRGHTVQDVKAVFAMAREVGFTNINMDLIVGLPGEDEEKVANTLEEIKKLDPDSLTIHSLALKRGTRLHLFQDEYARKSFKNSQEIMDLAAMAAYDCDMGPYYLYRQKNIAGNLENVGYAKTDKAGIYNILIMEEKQTILAAGAGASTKLVFDQGRRIERVENVKDVTHYITRIDEMIKRKRVGIETWLR